MPSSHSPSSSNGKGEAAHGPSSPVTPLAEAAGAVAHAQAMPRQFPSVFHRSPEVASCHDALLAALLSWQRTLAAAEPVKENGAASEGKGKDSDLQGSHNDAILAANATEALSLNDREELQQLKAVCDADTVSTAIENEGVKNGGGSPGSVEETLTAEGMRRLQTQVDEAKKQLEEAKARKDTTQSRIKGLFEGDVFDMLMSKVLSKHLKKRGAQPPSGKMELELYNAFMDVTQAEEIVARLQAELQKAEAIWNDPWEISRRLEEYCDGLWDTVAPLTQALSSGANDNEELLQLRAAFGAATVSTAVESETKQSENGGERPASVKETLTAEGMRKLRTQVDEAKKAVGESEGNERNHADTL